MYSTSCFCDMMPLIILSWFRIWIIDTKWLNKSQGWAWWHLPISPALQEAEEGWLLESRSSRTAWATRKTLSLPKKPQKTKHKKEISTTEGDYKTFILIKRDMASVFNMHYLMNYCILLIHLSYHKYIL